MKVKYLQENMTYAEMCKYIKTHKKYKLFTAEELCGIKPDVIATFCQESLMNMNGNTVLVYHKNGGTIQVNKLIKLSVVLTYSEEYNKLHEEILDYLKKNKSKSKSAVLLRELSEYL